MARVLEQGKPLYIPFHNGVTIMDSQNHLRHYKSVEAFKRHFPMQEYDVLLEYVPKVHGRWELYGDDDSLGCSYFCSECGYCMCEEEYHDQFSSFRYCPNCGADMREVSDA